MTCQAYPDTPIDDAVKEALAAELVPVIWWFFSVCFFSFFTRSWFNLNL
jgi:hypothetical protein